MNHSASHTDGFKWRDIADLMKRPQPVTLPMVMLFAIIPVYLFIGHTLIPGRELHVPAIAWDDAIPLWPAWSLVYGSLFLAALLPVFVVYQRLGVMPAPRGQVLQYSNATVRGRVKCFPLPRSSVQASSLSQPNSNSNAPCKCVPANAIPIDRYNAAGPLNITTMNTTKTGAWICSIVAAALITVPAAVKAAISEEVIEMPIEVKNRFGLEAKRIMKIAVLRDDARPVPQPFLILGHGRPANGNFSGTSWTSYRTQARYFVSRGFAVFVPVRVGYGETGGLDVEESGSCDNRDFEYSYRVGGEQTRKVIALAKTLPYVNPARGIVAGQSYGGALAIEAAGGNIPGVVAAINFAGGGGGDPVGRPGNPCRADRIENLFAAYGKTARIPTLWLYSENDAFWGQKIPHDWFAAFVKSGGIGEFIQLGPVENAPPSAGHLAFSRSMKEWRPHVERFLASVGFEKP